MNTGWTDVAASMVGQLATLALMAATVLLWLRRRTPWLLVAMVGAVASMLCRALVGIAPSLYAEQQALRMFWPLASLVFAVGLLCHALIETPPRNGSSP